MNIRTIATLGLAIGGIFAAQAQQDAPWTLRQCIDYAIKNNITIRQSAVTASQSQVELNTNKWARLPNVSGSASQNWSWGRTASPVDNSYTDTHSSNSGFSLSGDVPVFTGFRIPNQYKLSQLNVRAALADLEKAKEDLSINIASNYLQTLLDKELCKVALSQVALSQQQLDRLTSMEEAGKASPAEVAEARATLEQNKLSSVQNENTYRLALLDLSQLLELKTPEGFEIAQPAEDFKFVALTSPDDIFRTALAQKPSIRAALYRLQGSEFSVKLARAGYMPQISLGLGLGTSYYTMKGITSDNFGSQLKNNFNKYVGISVSVPIFDRFSTRNSIRTAKLQQQNLLLQLDDTKKALYKEIQQAWYSAVAAEKKYVSSQSAVEAAQASFTLMKEKYENGRATAVEYSEAQTKLRNAQSDLLQAKYDYIFRCKILDFYKGVAIS
jgi:outer membrane protein